MKQIIENIFKIKTNNGKSTETMKDSFDIEKIKELIKNIQN